LTAYQLTYNNGSVLIGGELLGYTTVVYVGGAFALVKGYADDRFSWRSIAQFQGSIACSVANTQYACPIALTATLRGAASDFAFTSNQVTPIRDGMISFYMSPDRASTNTRLIVSNSILTVLQDTGNGTGTAGNAIYNQVSMPCCSGSAASVQVLSGTPCNVTVNGAIYLF
jgi:hypothetical protein